MRKKKTVGIIGTGRAASALLRHFTATDLIDVGLWGRNPLKVTDLCSDYGIKGYDELRQLVQASDIVLLAVSDSAIEEITREIVALCANEDPILSGKIFGHLSGALRSDILSPLNRHGACVLSIHPIQALPWKSSTASDQLEDAWFSLEGDEGGVLVLEQLLKDFGNPCFQIRPESKALYHAALCTLSNYAVTLMNSGFEMLLMAGVDEGTAKKATRSLVMENIKNCLDAGPRESLTGPISRGDLVTVERHMQALSARPEMLSFYGSMGLETLKLAGLDEERGIAMEILLRRMMEGAGNNEQSI